ncbi:hypothetical protein V8E53_011395, partial [Lactarius tabidus]
MSRPGSPSSRESPSGVSPAPPPWSLKTKHYVFFTSVKPGNREDPVLQGLPPGSYNPSETLHPAALALLDGSPQWKGGLACVILAYHEDSPVGPYDELLVAFNGFSNPYQKGTDWRITNIFVSTRESIWNGRKNWNTPKHLACFKVVPTGPMVSNVEVSLPDAERPFFTASLTNSRLPAIPLPFSLVKPFTSLVLPPLLPGRPEDVQIGTDDEWLSIAPHYDGWCQLVYIHPSESGLATFGDGLHFPKFQSFWLGAKFTGTITFPGGVQLRTKT